ncbi:hypothetical protein GCM10022630_23960 [Thermobifida alba]
MVRRRTRARPRWSDRTEPGLDGIGAGRFTARPRSGAVTPVWNPYSADCWASSFFTRFSNMRTNSGRLAWAAS